MEVVALERSKAQTVAPDYPGTRPKRSPLRVGLFVSTRWQPRALANAFAEISRSEFARVVVLGVSDQAPPALPWVWRAYRWLDLKIFSSWDGAADDVDLTAFLKSTKILRIPDSLAGACAINYGYAKIMEQQLDVALILGEVACKSLECAAKYGVWRLDFGQRQERIPGLEGFREVAEGLAMTRSSLSITRPGDGQKLLYESRSRTAPFSPTRNRQKLMRRAAQLPGRLLKELHQSGEAAFGRRLGQAPQVHQRASIADLNLMCSLFRIGERMAWRCLQKLFCVEQWFLAYRFSNLADEQPGRGKFRCLMPPADRFWADPFPLERDGRHFIFFEERVFAEGKAHISVIEIDPQGRCSVPIRVLERPYHLSYPFLIESDGKLFMVPETGQNGSVELYRCLHFPDRWVFEKVLLQVPYCVDASFHRADGKWWMFVSIGADEADASIHDELHVYYADSLYGEWQAHCQNPVKSDVRSARPAGRLYEQDGKLYRPSQIGAPLYGSGLSINQVVKLTTQEYQEQEIGRFVPSCTDPVLGVHTVNRAGNLSVVDGFARRRHWGQERLEFFEPAWLGPDFEFAEAR